MWTTPYLQFIIFLGTEELGEGSSESQSKKTKLGQVDQYEASHYFCKMSIDEKAEAEKNLRDMLTKGVVNDKDFFLKFRKFQRNVFLDMDVQTQMEDFPFLKKVRNLKNL